MKFTRNAIELSDVLAEQVFELTVSGMYWAMHMLDAAKETFRDHPEVAEKLDALVGEPVSHILSDYSKQTLKEFTDAANKACDKILAVLQGEAEPQLCTCGCNEEYGPRSICAHLEDLSFLLGEHLNYLERTTLLVEHFIDHMLTDEEEELLYTALHQHISGNMGFVSEE